MQKRPTERLDVGALVFVFARANGTFGIRSTNGELEAWGSTLDQAWGRYYKKGERLMKKKKIGPYAEPAPEGADGANVTEVAAPEEFTEA